MSDNNKTSRFIPVIIAVSIVVGILIGTFYANHFSGNRLSIINTSSNKLNDLLRIIDDKYVDSVSMGDLVEKAMPQILAELDPHSMYISAKDVEASNADLKGHFSGIGVSFTIQKDTICINSVIQGGPSEKVGLMPGDRIIAVDDSAFVGKVVTNENAMKKLKGEKGSVVKLGIYRPGVKETLDFTVVRGDIPVKSVDTYYMLTDKIGYIKLNKLAETPYAEVMIGIATLQQQGSEGLVIDLRGNTGGYLGSAVNIINEFLPRNSLIVYTEGRKSRREEFRSDGRGTNQKTPIVLLTDEISASASEIFSGAIQDNDRGLIIGRRTFGKGLVQTPRQLGNNSFLKVTTAKYYIPSGRCIQAGDYSHSQQGSVRTVPDSLISEFTTRAGRKVYDGGGIMPDLVTEPEYVSRFAVTLYALGFIEDFGDDYMRRHVGDTIDVRTFTITDADYADFAEFMKDKKVPYESDTRRALKALKKAAEEDRFEALAAKFERVESELKDDTQPTLEPYRREVVDAINNDIILRHAYTAGVIEHSLTDDAELQQAVGVFQSPDEYRRITTEQDTKKK